MRTLSANDSLMLLSGQCLSCRSVDSLWLRADAGCLWLTGYGLPTDIWLTAGESVILPPNRHLVIQADATLARLDVLSPQALQYCAQALPDALRAAADAGKTMLNKAWLFPYILRRDASYNTGTAANPALNAG